MSLIIKHSNNNDPFDDSMSRRACTRYCTQIKDWEVFTNAEHAPIDICVRKPDGKYIAIELACNSCWTNNLEYPAGDIHIPSRKFQYFIDALYKNPETNTMKYNVGYYMLFNVPHTRAAILTFKSLINNMNDFEDSIMPLNGQACEVKLVPTTFIKKYIDIPK